MQLASAADHRRWRSGTCASYQLSGTHSEYCMALLYAAEAGADGRPLLISGSADHTVCLTDVALARTRHTANIGSGDGAAAARAQAAADDAVEAAEERFLESVVLRSSGGSGGGSGSGDAGSGAGGGGGGSGGGAAASGPTRAPPRPPRTPSSATAAKS